VELYEQSDPGTFDAILMDVMMPVMDGLTAAKTIRASFRPDAKTIPILAMTANAYDEDIKKTKDAGMNSHLSKPIDEEMLLKTLARYY
jgi:CheY-like chemotaxis protein